VLIYCSDNKIVDISIAQSEFNGKLFSWGKNENAALRILKIEKSSKCTMTSVRFDGIDTEFTIPFTDDASIENTFQCVALMLYLGYKMEHITQRILLLEA